MSIDCPHCAKRYQIEGELPRLPEALGFTCGECLLYFVVWQHPDGLVHASSVTLNNQAKA